MATVNVIVTREGDMYVLDIEGHGVTQALVQVDIESIVRDYLKVLGVEGADDAEVALVPPPEALAVARVEVDDVEIEILPQVMGQASPMDLVLEVPGRGAWMVLGGTREEILEFALRIIDELPRKAR